MIASLILLLYLTGFVSPASAITSLYVAGALLLIAEIAIVSFGLIALNGFLALYAAYTLQSGADIIFGIPMGWPVMFGIAFVEIFVIVAVISVHVWLRKRKTVIGTESMIGQKATIIDWSEQKGTVRFEGEIWKAKSEHILDLSEDDEVTVEAVNKLDINIKV